MKNNYKLFLIILTVLFLAANLIIYWYSIIPLSSNIDLTKDNVTYEFPLNFVPPGENTYALGLNIPNAKPEDLFPAPAGSQKSNTDIRDLNIILRISIIGHDRQPVFNKEETMEYWSPTNMPLLSGSNMTLYRSCGIPTAYGNNLAKKLLLTVVRGNSKAVSFNPRFFIFPKLMGEEFYGMVIFVNIILLIFLFCGSLFALIYRKYLKKKIERT